MPYTVGLTGGIGSGKSAVAQLFAGLGATVIDSDGIAHELSGPGGAAIGKIRATFGVEMIRPDGSLDRDRMRTLVFGNPAAREKLEAILHPLIREESTRRAMRAAGPYVVLVIPLLIEGGLDRSRIQRVLVVDCTEAQQIARVMERSSLQESEVRAILSAQVSRAERLTQAEDVIDNSGPRAALGPQVARLHEKYLVLAARIEAKP
jgi:dephospho-CoA kinase